jgi:uncharacterized protein DUF6968
MEIIAERTLEFLESGTTQPHKIRIVLGKPVQVVLGDPAQAVMGEPVPLAPGEPAPEGSCWSAPYGIHGPGEAALEKSSFGEDSLQALMMAIYILPTLLETMFTRRGILTCDGGPWDAGLGKLILPPTPDVLTPSTP